MPKNLGTAREVLFSSDPAHGRFPPPWTVEELDALSANQPMTAEQAATLKRLAEAAYELEAFQPNLTRAEADLRCTYKSRLMKNLWR
jgi:hypothetical protein